MVSELSEATQNRIRWWFYTVETNVVAADTGKKNSGENPVTENWEEYQRRPQAEEEFESKLNSGKYDKGIGVVCGRLWRGEHKGKYLTCIDADNQIAVDELCRDQNGSAKISNLADKTLVEGHDDDLSRIKAFYVTPTPLNGKAINKDKNHNKNAYSSKPSLEVKGISRNGKFELAFVSPSSHRDGRPYRPLGIQEIAVLDKEEKEKLELRLQDICKKYGMEYLHNEDEVHNYIKYLEQPDTVLEEGRRHNSLIEIASSFYFRWHGEWGKMTDEQRYAKLIEYDKAHCKPPLRDTDPDELDRIWEDTIKYGKDRRDEEKKGREDKGRFSNSSSYNGYQGSYNKQTIYNQLPVAVRLGLDGNIWEVIRYNPIKFVVGHTEYKQIVFASISSRRQPKKRSKTDGGGRRSKNEFVLGIEEEEETIRMLEMEDIIINALPVEIIKHENPLVFSEQKYSIKFTSNITRNFTIAHKTLDEIVSELDHKSLIYMKKSAREALAVMVGAFSNDNKLVVNEDLDYPGFYFINGKLTENDVLGSLGIDYKAIPSKDDILECIEFIDALIKYEREEIVPTMLRYSVISPFGFALKQYTNDNVWIKPLFLVGNGRTGKTTLTDAACALYYEWRSTKGKTTFASANTESRLGNTVSGGTFPICINEMGVLDDMRYRNIVEMLKNCIPTQEARAKSHNKSTSSYGKIPATRTLMFTGNFSPPRDDAFLSRITKIVFTRMDKHTRKEVEEFNKFMDGNAHKLRTLGNFAISYIMNNPTCLLKEVTAKEIISKFYELVDMKPPYWIDYVISEAKDDSGYIAEGEEEFDDTSMHLRSVLIKYFNELYNRYVKNLAYMTDSNGKLITDQPSNPSLLDRIKFCIERNVTTSISLGEDDTIAMFSTIMDELRENGIDTSLVASFAEVAGILDMEQGFKKLNKKTTRCISGTREKFLGFFECKIEG